MSCWSWLSFYLFIILVLKGEYPIDTAFFFLIKKYPVDTAFFFLIKKCPVDNGFLFLFFFFLVFIKECPVGTGFLFLSSFFGGWVLSYKEVPCLYLFFVLSGYYKGDPLCTGYYIWFLREAQLVLAFFFFL